jgi:hypothetical protein
MGLRSAMSSISVKQLHIAADVLTFEGHAKTTFLLSDLRLLRAAQE